MATGAAAGRASVRPVDRNGAAPRGSARSKSVSPRRPPSPARARPAAGDHDGAADVCRVRVAGRIRPKNADELAQGADFDNIVELQPEFCLFWVAGEGGDDALQVLDLKAGG
ncbi:kinesin-like protein KIN-UA isoform X2 [Lolium perenne]|uniref:kinesin-like protein KIN-UA isoform X2 n=1 Tax=Lolium perenne TaxID=4522 RepID=UPI0021F62C2A|nr:kinesin-like protein KIN-UA isoform X2 [Lolium perenne]